MRSSILLNGSTECIVVDGEMDRGIFTGYITQIPCPTLRPFDMVIMNNLSAHKNQNVVEHTKSMVRCSLDLGFRFESQRKHVE